MNQLPAHSELGASQMSRWDACPGSVALSRGIEGGTSQYAAEGTAAHEVAAFCLNEQASPHDQIGNVLKVDGLEITVTAEMADAVAVYLREIRSAYAEDPVRPTMLVEHKFHLKALHPKLHGTADCVLMYPEKKLLRVYDYKHGAGVPVDVANNKQLKYYGLGALLSSGMPADKVELIIVQPRCKHADGPVRVFKMDAMDLIDFGADLMDAVRRTEAPDAPLSAGDHCRWCKAAAICPDLAKRATAAAKLDFRPEVKYDPTVLAENLRWLPIFEGWIENVRKFAYAEAQKGSPPPGHKLVDKVARRKWAGDVSTTELALRRIGLDEATIFTAPELRSPAQIEKAIGKPKANAEKFAAVAELTVKESSGTVLVPDTDPREPHRHTAASDFAAA